MDKLHVAAEAVVDPADAADRGASRVDTTVTGFVAPEGFCHLLQVRTLAPGVTPSMTRKWQYIANTPYGMNIDSDIDLASPGTAANRSHKNGGHLGADQADSKHGVGLVVSGVQEDSAWQPDPVTTAELATWHGPTLNER